MVEQVAYHSPLTKELQLIRILGVIQFRALVTHSLDGHQERQRLIVIQPLLHSGQSINLFVQLVKLTGRVDLHQQHVDQQHVHMGVMQMGIVMRHLLYVKFGDK